MTKSILYGINLGMKINGHVMLCKSSLEWMCLLPISTNGYDIIPVYNSGRKPRVRNRVYRFSDLVENL